MRNFFLRLRAAWAFSQVHPHIAHAPEWTQDDAKKTAIFFDRSPTGRKIAKILWHHVQGAAFRATIERSHSTYECGYASGMRALASIVDSLSAVQKVTPLDKEAEELMRDIPEELRPLMNQ